LTEQVVKRDPNPNKYQRNIEGTTFEGAYQALTLGKLR